MSRVNWKQIHDEDFAVPSEVPLVDLTEELTRMLGSTDPAARDDTGYATLATWVARGVYDDLLTGLGDGMVCGLAVGLGEPEGDDVFRRSFSALVLAECIERDNGRPLVLGGKVLEWGDAVVTWLLRERDLRGHVAGKGWAHAVAHGADALATLARSPHFGAAELTVLLDVIADRVLLAAPLLGHGEHDRLARATLAVVRRGSVPLTVLEPWVNRIAGGAGVVMTGGVSVDDPMIRSDPYLACANAQAFLRSLYLLLALGSPQPGVRADLMLVLVEAMRASNPAFRSPL